MKSNEDKEAKGRQEVLTVDPFNWIVPKCCQEGLDSCPHSAKRERAKRRNVGL